MPRKLPSVPTLAEMKAFLDRARGYQEQFTPGFYHGSGSPNIKAFDPKKGFLSGVKEEEKIVPNVIFASPKPQFAESFLPEGLDSSYRTGSTIYPISVNKGKHFDPHTPEGSEVIKQYLINKYKKEADTYGFDEILNQKHEHYMDKLTDPINNWKLLENPEILKHLQSSGHDTFSVTEGGVKNIGIFDPKNIRGKFADYNPDEAMSPDFMKAEGGLIHMAPGGKVPEAVVKAYKLFRTKPNDPETLYPLFVNANKPVPMNEWVNAEVGPVAASGKVKSKLGELAYRPGWHAGDLPIATHIGGKSDPTLKAPDYRRPDEVWAEVEMPNDVDWQTIANQRAQTNKAGKVIPRTAHITDQVPEGGHYRYKTSPNMEGNWLIGGNMKVNRILTNEEVQAINEAAGMADLPRFTPLPGKADGGSIGHFQVGGKIDLALNLAKKIAPKFDINAVQNMPVGSAAKQVPVARAFQMLSSENVDPAVKAKIFKDYIAKHPDLIRKSGATNYDELTQAAYQQMVKETKDQYDVMTGSGIKLDWDPTGSKGYKSSAEMLKDAGQNKHLTVFQGGEPHPFVPQKSNEQFRAVHDYFGHGTTGASFGPKGEELAYGAHSQMYSPLARLAAATETRGQNSFVNYSGINDELIKKMNEARARGASPEELQQLGQQWQYAPQKGLILPSEQVDINYKGYSAGGEIIKQALQHAKSVPFVHFSKSSNISRLEPAMYGTGIRGAEGVRLQDAPDIRPRSYFYTDRPDVRPEQGLGSHKYSGVSELSYPLHGDPAGFYKLAKELAKDQYFAKQGKEIVDQPKMLNEVERAIKKAGYTGYHTDDAGILFNPTEVKKITE